MTTFLLLLLIPVSRPFLSLQTFFPGGEASEWWILACSVLVIETGPERPEIRDVDHDSIAAFRFISQGCQQHDFFMGDRHGRSRRVSVAMDPKLP
jgi:hypothetical protein